MRMGRTSSRLRKGLPRWLWTFFWDVDPKALDPVEYRDFILGRLPARGDWRAWKWVRRHWTEEELREFLLRTRGRGIDEPERLTFYALMLGIPYETIHGSLAGSPVRSAGPISRTSARPERDASRLDVPGKARMLGLPIKALRLMWRCRRDPPAHRVRRRIGESHRSDRGAAPPAGSGKSESKGG
jgi:hypothetical protein